MLRPVLKKMMEIFSSKKIIGMLMIILLTLFFCNADWGRILDLLMTIGNQFWWILPINLAGYFLGTLSWRYCMNKKDEISHDLIDLFIIRHIGESLAIINPTNVIAGDGIKYFLFKSIKRNDDLCEHIKESGSADSSGMLTPLDSVILSRLVLVLGAIFLALLACAWLMTVSLVWVLITACLPILLGYCILKKGGTAGRNSPQSDLQYDWIYKILKKLKKHYITIHLFISFCPGRFAIAFIFAVLHWFFGGIEFWYILKLLGVELHLLDGLTIEMGVTAFKTIGSVIPGQVGVEEYGNKIMLGLLGITASTLWISVSILRRARQIFWLTVGGLFYFIHLRNHGSFIHNT